MGSSISNLSVHKERIKLSSVNKEVPVDTIDFLVLANERMIV